MKPMSPNRDMPKANEVDLDSTAELPVLDNDMLEVLERQENEAIAAEDPDQTDQTQYLTATDLLPEMVANTAARELLADHQLEIELRLRTQAELHASAMLQAESRLDEMQELLLRSNQELTAVQHELEEERRLRKLQNVDVVRQVASFRNHGEEFLALQKQNEQLLENLRHSLGVQDFRASLFAEQDARVADFEQQIDRLRSQMQQAQQRHAEQVGIERLAREEALAQLSIYKAEVAQLRAQWAQQQLTQQKPAIETVAIRTASPLPTAELQDLEEQLQELRQELRQSRLQSQQFEEDLRVAEEQIQRLEKPRRGPPDLPPRDTPIGRPELRLVGGELPSRFLLRDENGQQVRHALGRKTSVGRTADNDIQIDTAFISRHHAIIQASTQLCLVEDLGSTNGVMVNGRRVSRQILHDGDTLTVGNTEFQFSQPA